MASVVPSFLNLAKPGFWVFNSEASTLAACSFHSSPIFEAFFMP